MPQQVNFNIWIIFLRSYEKSAIVPARLYLSDEEEFKDEKIKSAANTLIQINGLFIRHVYYRKMASISEVLLIKYQQRS